MSSANEIELSPETARALSEADRWVTESLSELGEVQLKLDEVRAKEKLLAARAATLSDRARNAMTQRSQVFAALVDPASLPEGEWTFSSENGKLIRRKPSDDQ